MKVTCGKKHKYLGMDIDFSMSGQVKILMCDYVKEILTTWDKVKIAPNVDGFQMVNRTKEKNRVQHPKIFLKLMLIQKSWDQIKQQVFTR